MEGNSGEGGIYWSQRYDSNQFGFIPLFLLLACIFRQLLIVAKADGLVADGFYDVSYSY